MATLRKRLIEVAPPLDAINLSPPVALSNDELLAGGSLRGPVWHEPASGEHYATAAGIVLLPRDPSAAFPQCRILADAYGGPSPTAIPATTRTSVVRCRSRLSAASLYAGAKDERRCTFLRKGLRDDEIIRKSSDVSSESSDPNLPLGLDRAGWKRAQRQVHSQRWLCVIHR